MIETYAAVRSDSSLTSRVHQRPRRMSDLKNTENTCTTDEQHQQQHHQQSAALTRFASDKQQQQHQQGGNSNSKLGHGGEELLLCGRSSIISGNDDTLSTVVTTTTGSSSISREPHFLWIPQPPSFVSVSQQKSGCSTTDPPPPPSSSVLLGNKCSGTSSSVVNVDESSSKSPSVVVSSSSVALNSTELLLQQRQQPSYSRSSSVIVREATHGSAVGDKASSGGVSPLSGVEIVRCELLWGAGGHQNQRHHEFVGFTPVEGCEIQPLVLLRDWNGRLFDDDEIEAKHHHHPHFDIQVHYRWLCGPPRAVCYFHTHKEAIYQCSGTLRCFCSYGCFLRGQKQLRKFYNSGGQYAIALHPNPHTYGVPCAKFPWDNYDSIREVDDRHFKLLKQASLLIDPRLSNWKAVSLTRNFIPTAAEVGRQLKFQCAICVTRRPHAEPTTQPPPPEDPLAGAPTQEDQPNGRPSSSSCSLYNNGYNGQQPNTQGGSSSSLGGVGACSSEDDDDQPSKTHHRISSPNNINNHLNYRSDEQSSRSFEDYCSSSSNNVQQQPSPNSPQLQQQQQQYYHLSHVSNSSSAAVRTQSLPHQPPGTHNIKHHPPIISSSSFRFGTNKPPLNPSSPMPASLKPPPHTTTVEQEVDFWVEWDQMEKERQQNVEKGTSTTSSSPHADSNIIVIHETGTQLTRSVTTACVVPQMPLAVKRDFLPVGMLAMFSRGGTPSTRFQRLRVAGRLVTEILGSKQATFLANQANPTGIIRKSFEASSRFAQTPEGGVNLRNAGSASSRRVRDKLTEEERAIIEATREDFLTEGYMAVRQALAQQELSLHQAQAAAASSMNAARSVRRTANENVVSSASGGSSDVWMSGGKASSVNPSGGTDSSDVSLMSWNVLAEIYATTEAFPYCDPYVLAWSYRRTRLLNEIISIAPDIVCLQEVQAEHFEDFFAPAMAEHGYEGLYKQKTVEIFTGTGKRTGGKFTCDGCATFFKVSKFRLVDNFGIEFSHLIESSVRQAPTFDNQNQQHKALRRLLKDNVALVLLLELQDSCPGGPRTSDQIRGEKNNNNNNCESITGIASPYPRRQLTVVNTHIVANPESPDVKLWQAQTLLNVVQDYMHEVALHNEFEYTRVYGPGRREPPPVGLVISGDFNSPPTSAVYELVTAGRCDLRHEEFSADRSNLLSGLAIGHRLQLRSAYGVAHMLRMEAERALQISGSASSSSTGNTTVLPIHNYEPEFTNYTRDFIGCLDYIFFNDAMRITGSLDLLTELTLIEEAHNLQLADWALPSPLRPSDHIPLVAKFVWNDSNPLIPKQTNKQ